MCLPHPVLTSSPLGPSPGRRLLSLGTAHLQLWPELPLPDSSSLHNSHLRRPGLCSSEPCFLLWGHVCWLWSPGLPSNTSGYSIFPSFERVAPGLPPLPGLKTVLNLSPSFGGRGDSQVVPVAENPPANARGNGRGLSPWARKTPWGRAWQPIPVFWPGAFHGQRSPAGYSPFSRKELEAAEVTERAYTRLCGFIACFDASL